MINRPTEVIVHGEYIPRGKFDKELDVRDFYFTPDEIKLLMDLLHTFEGDNQLNELYQELYTQVVYHPDKFYETNQPKVVVQTTLTTDGKPVILQV